MMADYREALCAKYNADFMPPSMNSELGIALNVQSGLMPINGLRHPPEGRTNGWYVWAGEVFEERDDFFAPLHVSHVGNWHHGIPKFLALPPGWRFLFADGYEDVWFDPTLLDI